MLRYSTPYPLSGKTYTSQGIKKAHLRRLGGSCPLQRGEGGRRQARIGLDAETSVVRMQPSPSVYVSVHRSSAAQCSPLPLHTTHAAERERREVYVGADIGRIYISF
jgi:hypothetical protein